MMKKKMILLVALCTCFAGAAIAQTVTVTDVEALPGETVAFSLNMNGGKADTYTSLQFNVTFPAEGFTTTGDYVISSAWKNASATIGDVDASGLAVVPVSSAEPISGSDVDHLLAVNFTVDNSVALGEYDVTLSAITFGYGFTDKDIAPDVTFKVRVVAAHTIVLDENSTSMPESATGVNVRVKRTINANEWSTICLPFAMSEAQVKNAFGDDVQLDDFNDYDFDGETINVKFTNASAIEANHPYIIKLGESVTEFTADGVDIEVDEEPMVNLGTKRRPHAMVGTYVANTTVENGCLFLSGNKFWYSVGLTKIKAYRAWFDFDDLLPDFEDNYAEARIFMVFDSEATGISTMHNDECVMHNEVYDLQGRRVEKPMKKGLYIRNGKKTVKK